MDRQVSGDGSRPLRDIMTTELVAMDPGDSLRIAIDILAGFRISAAPVVQAGRVVGVISASDILAFQASLPGLPSRRPDGVDADDGEDLPWIEGEDPDTAYFLEFWESTSQDAEGSRPAGWDALEEHTVDEVMTRGVHALAPEAEIREAAAVMATLGIHRVLVMEGERLVGLVSGSDIVRTVGSPGPRKDGNRFAVQRFEPRVPLGPIRG